MKVEKAKEIYLLIESERRRLGIGVGDFCSRVGIDRIKYWRFVKGDGEVELNLSYVLRCLEVLGVDMYVHRSATGS
jgi:hypothetical protein